MTLSAVVALGIRRANLNYYIRTGQALFSAPPPMEPRGTK
jgi:hypothetical protein